MNRLSRLTLFIVGVVFCVGLIGFSMAGLTAPAEGIVSVPLRWMQGALNGVVQGGGSIVDDLLEIQRLQQRIDDLLDEANACLYSETAHSFDLAQEAFGLATNHAYSVGETRSLRPRPCARSGQAGYALEVAAHTAHASWILARNSRG